MKKAVAYMRYSSHNQTEQSIEGQERCIKEYAALHEINIIATYVDRAKSGVTDNRPEFKKMLRDADAQTFDYVLIYSTDRFARNRFDAATHKKYLADLGVQVISVSENIVSGTAEGVLIESIFEGFAEYYSLELSRKVRRGNKESYKKGLFTGGVVTYGWDVRDKKLFVNNEEASAIKYFADNLSETKGAAEVIRELNNKGYRTKKGKPLNYNLFYRLFNCEKLIGKIEHDGVIYDNIYPPILSEQQLLKTRNTLQILSKRNPSSRSKIDYLLSLKLYCGECGSPMHGSSGSGRKQTYYYYLCKNREIEKSCTKSYEKKDYLENYVLSCTKQILTQPMIKHIASEVVNAYETEFNSTILDDLKTTKNKVSNELEKVFDLCLNATSKVVLEKCEKRAEELNDRIIQLDNEIKQQELIHKNCLTEEKIIAYLNDMKKASLSTDQKKILIDTFINSIYIYDDRIVIYYNLLDKKNTPPGSGSVWYGGGQGTRTPEAVLKILASRVCG